MGPCDWDVDTACCTAVWDSGTVEQQAAAISYATFVLWALSGRQYGPCPVTVRPCGSCVDQTYTTYGVWTDGTSHDAAGPSWNPYVDRGGNWRNCGCGALCCCEPSQRAWLGAGPIRSITEVRINNVVVPAENYRLEVGRGGNYWLVGQNGQAWPDCQDLDQAATSTSDTFVVTYPLGKPVPASGMTEAGRLACEYILACQGLPCAISRTATSISRDGVSYEVIPSSELVTKGYTGIPSVDLWITAVNPHRRPGRSRVWSPDMDFPVGVL